MRAAVVRKFGGPDIIEVLNVSKPEIRSNQILIRNHASGVNPVDTYVRSGQYAALPQLPYSPGKDGAGIVENVGSDVKNVKIGDRVWYGLEFGSTAEYTSVNTAFILPDDVSFSQGASLGVPYLTAYRALFYLANAKTGDTILVHGASGGVGSAIMQLAAWKGIKAVGTAGTEKGIDYVKSLNADNVYNHREEGYVAKLKSDYPNGFDYIFEMAAHINLNTDLGLLAPRGKVAVIGNRDETKINARQLMVTEGSVFGVALGRSTREDILNSGNDIVKFLKETKYRPLVHKEYPLESLGQAHIDIMSNVGALGNLIIKL